MNNPIKSTKRKVHSWKKEYEGKPYELNCYIYLTEDYGYLYEIEFIQDGACTYNAFCYDKEQVIDMICDMWFRKIMSFEEEM